MTMTFGMHLGHVGGPMNEMRKQVGELYAVPGGPLWRAAAQEVRLILEQRLGLAKK